MKAMALTYRNVRGSYLTGISTEIRGLLILLYGGEKNFLQAQPNMLEDLLLEYDKYVGNQEMVEKLSNGIGLPIPRDINIDVDMYFLTTIETYLLRGDPTFKDPIRPCRAGYPNIPRRVIDRLDLLRSIPVNNLAVF